MSAEFYQELHSFVQPSGSGRLAGKRGVQTFRPTRTRVGVVMAAAALLVSLPRTFEALSATPRMRSGGGVVVRSLHTEGVEVDWGVPPAHQESAIKGLAYAADYLRLMEVLPADPEVDRRVDDILRRYSRKSESEPI